jgi:hypothetical protein
VLDEVVVKIPVEAGNARNLGGTSRVHSILKAAANGQTNYDGLIATASEQIQAILSILT